MQNSFIFILLIQFAFVACDLEKKSSTLEQMTKKEQHAELLKNLNTLKNGYIDDNKYNCCTMPTCNWCLLRENGSCGCAKNLSNDKPVCPECKANWLEGKGIIPGFETEEIKSAIVHEHDKDMEEHIHAPGQEH